MKAWDSTLQAGLAGLGFIQKPVPGQCGHAIRMPRHRSLNQGAILPMSGAQNVFVIRYGAAEFPVWPGMDFQLSGDLNRIRNYFGELCNQIVNHW